MPSFNIFLTFYCILVQNVQGLVQKTYLSYRGTFPEQNILNQIKSFKSSISTASSILGFLISKKITYKMKSFIKEFLIIQLAFKMSDGT